ncbi:MAG: hypothetical protein EPO36_04825 [Chloroflexota bacterium]|nr:MAG: hypothetical protein EPO36_04825 [Chloroflexota bacterium]
MSVRTGMTSPLRPARRFHPVAAIVGTILLVTVAAGCSYLSRSTTSPGPTASPGPLLSVETRGGHCIGGTCGAIVVLESDGRVRTGEKPPNELGTISPEDLAGMTALIESTDFAAIRAHPFTDTCPVAFDGQEVVYEFTTSGGVERIESCVTEVDPRHPLFAAVTAVLESFISLPTE